MAEKGEPLSERELAVLGRLVDGSTNREIAQDLDISPNTVKVHLRNIFTKLDVSSRTEAVTVSLQRGLLIDPAVERAPEDPAPGTTSGGKHVAVDPASESSEVESDQGSASVYWRAVAIGLGVVLALVIIILLSSRLNGQEEQTGSNSSPVNGEGFMEEPIGDSKWFQSRALPRARASSAVAAVGLDLYQIGGEVEAGVVNLVDVFGTSTLQWDEAASKPTAVADASAAVLFGEIYVPGGRLADGNPTSVVEAYSPVNDAWRPVPPLPRPLSGSLTLSDGALLYVLGGWDGQDYSGDAYIFDPGTSEWQQAPSMSHPRAQAAGAALANQLFIVGGSDGSAELKSCEYYDIVESEWFSCPDMEFARAGAGAAILGNKLLYVIGGGSAATVTSGEVYDVDSDLWEQVAMPMLDKRVSWYDLGVANVETRIYTLGGRYDGNLVDFNYIYNPLIHQMFLPAVGGDN